jgi:hypothetical protein
LTKSNSTTGGHGHVVAGGSAAIKGPNAFQRLQRRSFGGEDVATRPGAEDDAWWPKGEPLPGVKELMDAFVKAVDHGQGLTLAFLLGGAGNGKSFAARQLGDHLGLEVRSTDALAHRAYRLQRGRTAVELLNDATIAARDDYGERQSVALAADLRRWECAMGEGPAASFCCVNRGIIVDELRALDQWREELGAFAAAVLAWLAAPARSIADALGATREARPAFAPKGLDVGDHFRDETFRWREHVVWVAALSVDAFSLMEPVAAGRASRAGALFRDVVLRCETEASARPPLCPIRANVAQWRQPNMADAWESLMRDAEIGSGRPHSWREVWGLAALSLLGPRFVEDDDAPDLLRHIDDGLNRAQAAESPRDRLIPLLALSRFRSHEALFRATYPGGEDFTPTFPPFTPAHLGLSLVDPSTWGTDASAAVEAAMQAIAVGERPSRALARKALLPDAWSPFDDQLEAALVDFVVEEECPDGVRRRLISWWGGYMLRLVGLASGRFGNAGVVDAWRNCWRLSESGPASLPLELDASMRTLLFPAHSEDAPNRLLIPALAARVEPHRASRDGPAATLAESISVNSVDLRVARAAGRLVLECCLAGRGKVVGRLLLDFALMREALACRAGRVGQTESTAFVEPRVERFRAAVVQALPPTVRQLVAISGAHRVDLSL